MSTEFTDETQSINEQDRDHRDETDGDMIEQSAKLELLAEENRRLRSEYARARQSQYRRTAIGLAAIGVCGLVGGVLFPDTREALVAFGMTGLFGAVLTYFLTPEQFVAADVGERVYAATAANGAAIVAELGLRDERVYLPDGGLYIPLLPEYELPTATDGPFVLDADSRGLRFEPTGVPLLEAFQQTVTGGLATTPVPLATQLCEAVTEQFELARGARPDVDVADGRVTVAITDSSFGDVDRFDHPIPSLLAVGLAVGLDRPIDLSVTEGDDRSDWLVTCRFEMRDEADREQGDGASEA